MSRGYSEREHECVGGHIRFDLTWWEFDGRGIELCRVCDKCRKEKLARYRPDIMGTYDCEEDIEPCEW